MGVDDMSSMPSIIMPNSVLQYFLPEMYIFFFHFAPFHELLHAPFSEYRCLPVFVIDAYMRHAPAADTVVQFAKHLKRLF